MPFHRALPYARSRFAATSRREALLLSPFDCYSSSRTRCRLARLLLGGVVAWAADVAVVDEFLLGFLCLVFDILLDERRQLVRLGSLLDLFEIRLHLVFDLDRIEIGQTRCCDLSQIGIIILQRRKQTLQGLLICRIELAQQPGRIPLL